jgi:hypothetical protein
MRATIFAVGVLTAFFTLVLGLVFLAWAGSISFQERTIVDGDADLYRLLNFLVYMSVIVACCGGMVAILGFATSRPISASNTPPSAPNVPSDQAGFCQNCGANLRSIDVWCPSCGQEVKKG